MAKNRMINTRFWIDDYITNLDPTEKLLFLYCLTNPYTDISGVYEVPLKHMAMETGIDKEMVAKILGRFEKDNKIVYLKGWIGIRNFAKHQQKNPKVSVGIENGLKQAPKELIDRLSIDYDGLSHLNSNINTNINSNSKKEDKVESVPRSEGFDEFWNEYPNKTNKKASAQLWESKLLWTEREKIVLFVKNAKNTDRWQRGFIKAPDVFLRNESWNDDLTAYGSANKNDVYKNKTRTDYAEKLKAKQQTT